MDSESEDEEPSVLEYARLHGLCIDYTTEQLPSGHLKAVSDATINLDLDVQVPPDALITNTISELTKERLTINTDAAAILKSVYDLQQAFISDSFAIEKRTWILNLKQEVPLLETDSELDVLSFGSAALPNLKNLKIPFEKVVEESDEGMEWPSKYYVYPAQYDEQAKREKIAISKEVLVYLQDAVRDTHIPEDSEMIKAETLNYKLVCRENSYRAAC